MKKMIRNKTEFSPLGKKKRDMLGRGFKPNPSLRTGFTLIELMIVVAVIGILAAIATASFVVYRNKSRVATATGTCESIRAGQGGYAAIDLDNLFPAESAINTWAGLRSVMRQEGVDLKARAESQGLTPVFTYNTIDLDADNTRDDYYYVFRVAGVPQTLTGSQIEIRPGGIEKQTY